MRFSLGVHWHNRTLISILIRAAHAYMNPKCMHKKFCNTIHTFIPSERSKLSMVIKRIHLALFCSLSCAWVRFANAHNIQFSISKQSENMRKNNSAVHGYVGWLWKCECGNAHARKATALQTLLKKLRNVQRASKGIPVGLRHRSIYC